MDKKFDLLSQVYFLAAEIGFEPIRAESESAVLPLHNSAPFLFASLLYSKKQKCQEGN